MTHAERDWRDAQPGEDPLDKDARPAGRLNGDDPPVQDVHGDPLAERVHEDDPLVEDVHGDPQAAAPEDPVAAAPEDPVAADVLGGDPLAEPVRGVTGGVDGVAGAPQEPPDQLSGDGEHDRFVARWQEIQAGFVDEPRRAVQDADALVVDLMDRLARILAEERDRLESRPGTGEDVSTEDLRQGLRRYRSLFERLLAV